MSTHANCDEARIEDGVPDGEVAVPEKKRRKEEARNNHPHLP